jgi:prophage tail gpP-like protein
MLIVRIEFRGSRQGGTTTTLTLVPRGSMVLVPTEPTT